MNKRIHTETNDFFFLEQGDSSKKTILFLHGFADSAAMFRRLANKLQGTYHVYALDFPMSREPTKIYDVESLTDFVNEFVKATNLKKFTLAGFSLGGLVAINYAARFVGKVEELYVLNSLPQLITQKQQKWLRALKPALKSKAWCKAYAKFDANKSLRKIFRKPAVAEDTRMRMRNCPLSVFGTLFNFLDLELKEAFNLLPLKKTIVLCADDRILKIRRYFPLLTELNGDIRIFKQGGHAESEQYWRNLLSLFFGSYSRSGLMYEFARLRRACPAPSGHLGTITTYTR